MRYQEVQLTHTKEIMQDYHVNSLMAKVIEANGLSKSAYDALMNPRLIYHDFLLFSEGEMALERIGEAIAGKEKICIYGDYDCDGILATAILVEAFKELGVSVGYHIPHRMIDGYGLNAERVRQMAEKGYTLIITVDNGIKAHEAIDVANALGIDVIITDHHTCDEENLPDALAIIHTALSIDYPFKPICGGVIAYKLAAALLGHHDKYLYSLAAITTVSDMMPLYDENRSMVKRGLSFMNEEKYPQLELLLGHQKTYDTQTIGFTIAPKINSFGRLPEMVNPNVLVRYFLKDASPSFLAQVANKAIQINTRRQNLTTTQYQLALKQADDVCLYYGSEELHEGIVGLIAGRYTREFERPGMIMHYNAKQRCYVGSMRGVAGFPVVDFFARHDDLLEVWGGHEMAGGFTVSAARYEALHDALRQDAAKQNFETVEDVIPVTYQDISLASVASLEGLEPFGQGNQAPVFMLKDVAFDHLITLSEGKHLRFDLSGAPEHMRALYFHKGALYDDYKDAASLTLIGTLGINEFRNMRSVNFIIQDILQ